ncbi:B1 protein [Anoplophora glabripennis]|nr:B1 protein [Anoplophora glabripennis]
MMRTCAILVFIATLVVSIHCATDEEREKFKALHNECQADPKSHIDEESLKKYIKGELLDKSVVGSYAFCISKKVGFLNEEGKINKENLKKALGRNISDEAKLNEAVNKCAVEKDDPQDTAIAIGKCFREQAGLAQS